MRHLWNTFRDWLGSDWLLIPLLLFGPLMVLWSQALHLVKKMMLSSISYSL